MIKKPSRVRRAPTSRDQLIAAANRADETFAGLLTDLEAGNLSGLRVQIQAMRAAAREDYCAQIRAAVR
jgi:hypothetical protein